MLHRTPGLEASLCLENVHQWNYFRHKLVLHLEKEKQLDEQTQIKKEREEQMKIARTKL